MNILFSNLDLYQDGVRSDVCIQPCSTMAIAYGYPTLDANTSSYARIKFYFKSNVQVISFLTTNTN